MRPWRPGLRSGQAVSSFGGSSIGCSAVSSAITASTSSPYSMPSSARGALLNPTMLSPPICAMRSLAE